MKFFVKQDFDIKGFKNRLNELRIPYNKVEKSYNDLFVFGILTEQEKQVLKSVVNSINMGE